MTKSVTQFVDDIDGVRGGVAQAVGRKFDTVAALSEADTDTLTAVKGVGPVLAERILGAARTAVITADTPEEEPTPAPRARARASVGQARAATRPALAVVEGEARHIAEEATTRARAIPADRDEDTSLPALVELVAGLVGRTVGWGFRVVRTVTQPVHHLLRRG